MIINIGAAWALGFNRFVLAGVVMICANIFDFIDGKVAHELQLQSRFGAFWDSTLDRFSDLALLTGLIYLYSSLGRTDYVMWASLTLIFSIMTSYARGRCRSRVQGHSWRPGIAKVHDRGVPTGGRQRCRVILTLPCSRWRPIYYTYLAPNDLHALEDQRRAFNRAFFSTDERTTVPRSWGD